MQPQSASLQHGSGTARQEYFQPAQALGGNPPPASNDKGGHHQLTGTLTTQLMADMPSIEPFEHPLEQSELCLRCNCSLCLLEVATVQHVTYVVVGRV